MKKNYIKLFLFSIFTMFLGVSLVSAEINYENQGFMIQRLATTNPKITSISVSGDVATVRSSGTVYGYYVGTTKNINANTTYFQGVTSNTFYAGVKNGTYYFWVSSGDTTHSVLYSSAVTVTSSCSNQVALNKTGAGVVERCFRLDAGETSLKADLTGTLVTCAEGYALSTEGIKIKENHCKGLTSTIGGQTVKNRYCRVVYSYNCVSKSSGGGGGGGTPVTPPAPVADPRLSSLSVSGASINPAFGSETFSYTATVGADTGSVSINASAASGTSFVNGFGPRQVDLWYGSNNIQVKVQNSAGKQAIYNINIVRPDNRSAVNTLRELTVSAGELNPDFSSDRTSYNLNVNNDVEKITIDATLTDPASHFVEGFAPREVLLQPGLNSVQVRVMSERGTTNVYTINVMRATEDAICSSEPENKALLKKVKFVSDQEKVTFPNIHFESTQFNYPDIQIPYDVANLGIEVSTVDEGDTFVISDTNNLEVGKERNVTISVTSKKCPSITKEYTLLVTRQEEHIPSSNNELKSLVVKGHDEVHFQPNQMHYDITLHKNEKSLEFEWTPEDEMTICEAEDNKELKIHSEVKLICKAENGESTEYVFEVQKVNKGANVFLIIIVVILVILVLIYLVLRVLGYKIYFNFAMIGAFFRGIGEKIRSLFDK